jgi:hypothetical protein
MKTSAKDTTRIRETFTIPKYISDELNHISKLFQKKKSHIVSKALEEYFAKNRFKILERKRAFNKILEIAEKIPSDQIGNYKIQEILGIDEN